MKLKEKKLVKSKESILSYQVQINAINELLAKISTGKNFKELVEILVRKYKLNEQDLAIDIGSNDGTLLKNYVMHNVKILGVEPSSVAEIAIKNKIPTVKKFFNKENN